MVSSADTVTVIVRDSLTGGFVEELGASVARRRYRNRFVQMSVDSGIELLPFFYGWPAWLAWVTVVARISACGYSRNKQTQ
jgi:hypothetical protein